MQDFDRKILERLEAGFDDAETETLAFTPDSGDASYAVKVIHKPTGVEIVNNDFKSQIKNKAAALAELLSTLRKS